MTEEGEVYAWGKNDFGQIGNGSYEDALTPFRLNGFNEQIVKSISCGAYHSIALAESGHVYSWGNNNSG